MIATADSGILACGQMMRPNGSRESYIVKLDASGNLFNPLSVIEKKKETYLHLYPNPANASVSLHYLGVNKNVTLNITNLQGQSIYKEKITTNDSRITINTTQFAPGFYFCNVYVEGRMLVSKKLVVVR